MPIKGGSRSDMLQQFPPLGGKGKGKSSSTNKPKEPAVPKQEGVDPSSKPKGAAIATQLKLQSPPVKAGGAVSLVIAKSPATPKPKADGAAPAEQPQSKAEAVTVIDQPKSKGEEVTVPDQPKTKAKSGTIDLPKAKADPVGDPPKAEGQPKSLLSLASLKGRLGFGPPTKPERPPAPTQIEADALEDDEDTDMQAALHESLKAPSSPQPESGAQSSTPKPATVDQQESDLIAQLDRLMQESVRLESLPNPSVRDRSRLRSIDVVAKGIEKQLEEIEARRASSSKIPQPQESVAPVVMPSAATTPLRGSTTTEVKMVSPPSGQPLTIEKLMSGIKVVVPEPSPTTIDPHDQPKAPPADPGADHPQPKERSPVRQPKPESPPRAIPPAVPAIEDRPRLEKEVSKEPPKERERELRVGSPLVRGNVNLHLHLEILLRKIDNRLQLHLGSFLGKEEEGDGLRLHPVNILGKGGDDDLQLHLANIHNRDL